jgi:hypothetical protein
VSSFPLRNGVITDGAFQAPDLVTRLLQPGRKNGAKKAEDKRTLRGVLAKKPPLGTCSLRSIMKWTSTIKRWGKTSGKWPVP